MRSQFVMKTGPSTPRFSPLLMRGNVKRARREFELLAAALPEELVNLGLTHERDGNARLAYDAWVEAVRRGERRGQLGDVRRGPAAADDGVPRGDEPRHQGAAQATGGSRQHDQLHEYPEVQF